METAVVPQYLEPQPDPYRSTSAAVWPLVLAELGEIASLQGMPKWCHQALYEDMNARHAQGFRKYGLALTVSNGRNPLVDAYQEALDQVVYLRQAIGRGGPDILQRLYRKAIQQAAGIRMLLTPEAMAKAGNAE